MKAMILCAGLGTRLRPLTEHWPKPAIPLLGQPLFRYTLATLRRAGISSVGINTHHLPEVMAAVARREVDRVGASVHVVHEPVIQGTGGGIRGLRSFLEDDPFVIVNGDILFGVDLEKVIANHRLSGAAATLVLLPMPAGESYKSVDCDRSGRVWRIAGRGPGAAQLIPWHFSGVHVVNPEIFDFMSGEGPEDINQHVYPRMMEQGRVIRGEVVQAYWSDVGTPSRYLAAQRDLLFRQVAMSAFPGASPFDGTQELGINVWARDARVDGKVAGPAFFEGCQIEATAQIGSAVFVGAGARVGRGARLNRAAVLDDTVIGDDEEGVDCIAWRGHRIPAPR